MPVPYAKPSTRPLRGATARTAVTGAQNAGRMDSYAAAEKMGIKLKKEWMATLDSRTRHSHARLDGEQVDQDAKFSNGCRFPGDPRGKPAETYNCRCTMVAAVDGVDTSDAKRRARNPETGETELVSDMTYQEWENKKRSKQKVVGTTQILRYNDIIEKHINLDTHEVYIAAKNGERNKGVYADAIKKRQKNLEKSIASHTAQVEEHADKIRKPERYDAGWGDKDDLQKQGLLKKWGKDLRRNAEQAGIEIEVWKERFGDEQ